MTNVFFCRNILMSSGWLVLSSLGTCGSPAKCFHGEVNANPCRTISANVTMDTKSILKQIYKSGN